MMYRSYIASYAIILDDSILPVTGGTSETSPVPHFASALLLICGAGCDLIGSKQELFENWAIERKTAMNKNNREDWTWEIIKQ